MIDREGFQFDFETRRFIVNRWETKLGKKVRKRIIDGINSSSDIRGILDGYVLTSNILSITDMTFPYDGSPGSINGIQCPSPDWESWGDLSGLEHFISLEHFYAGGFYDQTLDWSSLINLKKIRIEEAWGLKNLILSNSP